MGALAQPDPGYAPAPGYRYHVELVNGREIEKPMPKKLHILIQRYLTLALTSLLPSGFGPMPELDIITGGQTKDGRREYIIPDLVVVRDDAPYIEGMLAVPPLLGVEILSPGQTITELFGRADRLVKIGAQNVWIIWPEKRRAWEVGADRIDERRDKLMLSLPAGTEPECVDIRLAEMWKVLDQE